MKTTAAAPPSGDDVKVFLGMSVPDVNALPACDAAQSGRVVYVIAEKGFRICNPGQDNGAWSIAGLNSGTATEKPEDVYQKAFALYGKYRKNVVRIRTDCVAGTTSTQSMGTGFLCAPKTICTAAHVVRCPAGTEMVQMNFHRVLSDRDSIQAGDDGLPPAFLMIPGEDVAAWTKTHPSRDLAKVQAPGPDAASQGSATGTIPDEPALPLATRPASESVKTLSWVMNMGFPLGFTDLYTDLGKVNSNKLATCGVTDYPCLAGKFDFSTTNDTDHGSSGSPLLSLDGQVIGVVTAGTDGENVNFTWAIDASLLSGF